MDNIYIFIVPNTAHNFTSVLVTLVALDYDLSHLELREGFFPHLYVNAVTLRVTAGLPEEVSSHNIFSIPGSLPALEERLIAMKEQQPIAEAVRKMKVEIKGTNPND